MVGGCAAKGHPPMNPNDPRFLTETFRYHAPLPQQVERYGKLREGAGLFADQILCACPDSAERTLAVRKVQEAVMWANASIAINESA